MPSTSTAKFPYYKVNKLLWTWTPCEGANGCQIVKQARLSMDKVPPPLRDQPPVKKAKPAAKQEKPDPAMKMLSDIERVANAFSRFKTWLDTPAPPRQPKPAPIRQEKTIPPFDIQEIPGAMRKLMMPVSAKLMEKWFSGQLNYSPEEAAEQALLNQDGRPYRPSMIDTTTMKMDWILEYARAKSQFENLINKLIYSERSIDMLSKKLSPYINSHEVKVWERCGDDLQLLHKNFQFQFAPVDGSLEQKAIQWFHRLPRGGTPDDLTGSLGSFNFYAAVSRATVDQRSRAVTVTHIVVYVKDHYTFDTKPGNPSQYLEHWNASGVIIVPEFVATDVAAWRWLDYPVLTGDMPTHLFKKDAVFYPIRNKTFREWQIKHKQGGDFVIYSDCKHIRLNSPIKVWL